jgi:hypothetical protein
MTNEWHPIETAPIDKEILTYRPSTTRGEVIATAAWIARDWRPSDGAGGIITHWMPLPPPPPKSLIQRFGRDWALREARRLAFDAGVDDASRITALQKLLRDL